MFVLKQSDTYTWPVTVKFPVSGGRHTEEKFDAEFKRITQSKIRDIQQRIADDQLTDIDLAKDVLVGWKGVLDENKNEIPFSIEAKDQLLEVALVGSAVAAAFFESFSGAKRKN